jgi:UDP-2,4-diacetamido-2,4,6-trideoxy-beta-L-altropyranose hydrolase
MRCLALAEAWQGMAGPTVFATAMNAPAMEQRLAAAGIEIVRLATDSGSDDDAAQTNALARQRKAAFVVADGYHFGGDYQYSIKDSGCQLMLIDDYGHAEHYFADLVLNQNLSAQANWYNSRELYTRLLLGTQYVLLRRQFLNYRAWQRSIPIVGRKVLVTMGGGDPDNVTSKVIKALVGLELESKIVVGGSNPHLAELEMEIQQLKIAELIVDTVNMPELMAWADVAVTAGGTTSWETAFMGLPSVVIVVAENQKGIAQSLDEAGAVVSLGWHEQASIEALAKEIEDLMRSFGMRRGMSERGRSLVDGNGVSRVIEALQLKADSSTEHAHSFSG